MEAPRVVALVALAVVVLLIGRVLWMIWRILWRNEHMESGGSEGRQWFGRGRSKDA
jgi:hypothetical protein